MPIDPATLTLISGLLQGVGGALTGGSQAKLTKQEIAERARQFNIGNARQFELGNRAQQLGEGQYANQLGLQNQSAGLRDQAAFALAGRLGTSPSAFAPRDIFNGSPVSGGMAPSLGGVDQNALKARMDTYQPGQGGMADTSLQQAILGRLGYTVGPNGQYQAGAPGGFTAASDPSVQQDLAQRTAALTKQQEQEALRRKVAGAVNRMGGR